MGRSHSHQAMRAGAGAQWLDGKKMGSIVLCAELPRIERWTSSVRYQYSADDSGNHKMNCAEIDFS